MLCCAIAVKGEIKKRVVVVVVLLTVRPSLFLPPSEYKLPSLGSGKKAGLGIKKTIRNIDVENLIKLS